MLLSLPAGTALLRATQKRPCRASRAYLKPPLGYFPATETSCRAGRIRCRLPFPGVGVDAGSRSSQARNIRWIRGRKHVLRFARFPASWIRTNCCDQDLDKSTALKFDFLLFLENLGYLASEISTTSGTIPRPAKASDCSGEKGNTCVVRFD